MSSLLMLESAKIQTDLHLLEPKKNKKDKFSYTEQEEKEMFISRAIIRTKK